MTINADEFVDLEEEEALTEEEQAEYQEMEAYYEKSLRKFLVSCYN